MAVRARAARTGVYRYAGREIDPENKHGLRDTAIVNVLRDEAAVFDERAVRSFIGKPITDDHPAAPVTAKNWRDHARGTIMGAVRDGDYLSFDLLLTDEPTVAKVSAGKRELSNGYACDIEIGDFTAADGTKCQARQKPGSIVGNHVAIVAEGRAGSECRIADAATCGQLPTEDFQSLMKLNDLTEKPMKTMLLDGFTVDLGNPDTAVATATTLRDARDEARRKIVDHEATITARDASIVAKDAEIAKLKTDVAAAKLTPAQMRDAGKAFAAIEAKAKQAGVTVTDAMDQDAIMKAVVDKMMPDNKYTGDHVAIAFEALTRDAKVSPLSTVQPINAPVIANDAAAIRDRAKRARNAG